MKTLVPLVSVLSLAAGGALAGGLDRSGQPIGVIFEKGNYGEIAISRTFPSVDGMDLATTGGTGEVALDFTQITGAFKMDINDQISFAVIFDSPFGSSIDYPVNATSVLLGGTQAISSSNSVTGVLRYKFNDNFSVHGGVRFQQIKGDITLSGLAYGPVNGYNVALSNDFGTGYLVGVAYERPDIALRIALTYNSAITHEMSSLETIGGTPIGAGVTEVKSPQSVNLDFQTGIAQDTLLFGSVRWAEWSELEIAPDTFNALTGAGLVDLEDTVTYTLGVGRRFNEKLSGSFSVSYEKASDDDLVSPLAPTNGLFSVSLGGRYQVSDEVNISGGLRYTWLGDAFAETGTPDVARAEMTDNTALSVGMKIGFTF